MQFVGALAQRSQALHGRGVGRPVFHGARDGVQVIGQFTGQAQRARHQPRAGVAILAAVQRIEVVRTARGGTQLVGACAQTAPQGRA